MIFTHHNQPYGTVTFEVEVDVVLQPPEERKVGNEYLYRRAEAGWRHLEGTVIKGSVTNRLFQHTSTRDLAGEPYHLDVPPAAYEKGEYVTVAG